MLVTLWHSMFEPVQQSSSIVKFRKHDDWHCAVLMNSMISKPAIKGRVMQNNSSTRCTAFILENPKVSFSVHFFHHTILIIIYPRVICFSQLQKRKICFLITKPPWWFAIESIVLVRYEGYKCRFLGQNFGCDWRPFGVRKSYIAFPPLPCRSRCSLDFYESLPLPCLLLYIVSWDIGSILQML